MSLPPGSIRDSILSYLQSKGADASTSEIFAAVSADLGSVPVSSVRSYLNLNTPRVFRRTGVGRYQLRGEHSEHEPEDANATALPACPGLLAEVGKAKLFQADCMTWLASQPANSIHAVVTDPPYGHREYTIQEQRKLRKGKGGIWRIPPSFDGSQRSPLPRFTVLDETDRAFLQVFFKNFATILNRVLVPGANVAIASNPLLAHLVSNALVVAGFEIRGSVVRLTMTMRGGDRPKNAHVEFNGVSVMPRSMWEPWVIARKPLEGRVQDNLRKWKTGGWRRPSEQKPFGDVIRSSPTTSRERKLANHPSLKPQSFLRELVRGCLPLQEGIVLDPFAGSGSTLAACNAVGYASVGLEKDPLYARMAAKAIGPLGRLHFVDPIGPELFDAVPI